MAQLSRDACRNVTGEPQLSVAVFVISTIECIVVLLDYIYSCLHKLYLELGSVI